jgi:ubiquinone/menaquinone biosynthesis C-methylase UbiE
MAAHVCPWWGGYFIDHRLRRLLHPPERILGSYVRPGMTALDFGCGMGIFTLALAKLVGDAGRVVAADLQPRMLDVLRKRAERAGLASRIQTHRCQPDRIGIASGSQFDFVLCFWSAHEVPDLPALLRELRDLLAADGRLLVVEPVGHVTAKAFSQMLTLAEEVGFARLESPPVRLSRAALLAKR